MACHKYMVNYLWSTLIGYRIYFKIIVGETWGLTSNLQPYNTTYTCCCSTKKLPQKGRKWSKNVQEINSVQTYISSG